MSEEKIKAFLKHCKTLMAEGDEDNFYKDIYEQIQQLQAENEKPKNQKEYVYKKELETEPEKVIKKVIVEPIFETTDEVKVYVVLINRIRMDSLNPNFSEYYSNVQVSTGKFLWAKKFANALATQLGVDCEVKE